jgi:thiamine pyrophosphate-dependent acetolactate synthase large subunit-like protein
MKFTDAFRSLARCRTDQVVIIPAGHSSRAWWAATEGDVRSTFYLSASMGMTTLFGAGLALARPELKVWAFMGDGGFCMNPGTLMVERQMNLPNLTHFLVSNRVYGGTLNSALPNSGNNDYPMIARGMGFKRVFEFRTLESIDREFPKILQDTSPDCTFISLEVERLNDSESRWPAKQPMDTEMKYLFGREIERRTGCNIFG